MLTCLSILKKKRKLKQNHDDMVKQNHKHRLQQFAQARGRDRIMILHHADSVSRTPHFRVTLNSLP